MIINDLDGLAHIPAEAEQDRLGIGNRLNRKFQSLDSVVAENWNLDIEHQEIVFVSELGCLDDGKISSRIGQSIFPPPF